ncbi:MAG: ferrous iron transporter B [Candidatus Omnitrophica bacterium]|nr:ferrous iron transporter B [Candidatus Omnitrophota bacterium]
MTKTAGFSVEETLGEIESLLSGDYRLSKRLVALLLLEEDEEIEEKVRQKEPQAVQKIKEVVAAFQSHSKDFIEYRLAVHYKRRAAHIASKAVRLREERTGFRKWVDLFLMHPVTGGIFLFLVLYWGLYRFVGVFGAGTVVDFFEDTVFGRYLNPWVEAFFTSVVPWQILRDLFVGEYGVVTLGVRYAVALILPIVTFFFIVFSIIEDTGYLPRLAMLLDRIFKKIGLSGRAVIPMVLGLGCDTMATLVTRTLPTRRERVIATLLLALAVPCSAQLGVILAILSPYPKAMMLWAGTTGFVFLLVGFLAARILPGQKPSFYIEIPPLRWPNVSNVAVKTYVRVKWYFKEVLPLFLLASVFIWFGRLTGLFDGLVNLLRWPMEQIGLPSKAAEIFLFGFFRRDYGAAGLYHLNDQGLLDVRQLVVAAVALTLFLPCIAQFLINVKERGWKAGLGISAFILVFSFGVAWVVNFLWGFVA